MTAASSIRVVAAVIGRDGRFLLALRPAHKRHGGLWEFPGGKLEAGETDTQAAARELREELGVAVTRVDAAIYEARDSGSPFVIAFCPVEMQGEPHALEHDDLRWCTVSELKSLPLAPTDATFVRWLAMPV